MDGGQQQSATVMPTKFERERDLVKRLTARLSLTIDHYEDPNAEAPETGADVVAVLPDGRRIAVQVTMLDTGEVPGQAQAAERAVALGTWAQPNPMPGIVAAIRRKALFNFGREYAEVWLLISAGIPEPGAIGATLVLSTLLSSDTLNAATAELLSQSNYSAAFLHPILNTEDALYRWTPEHQWEKLVNPPNDPGVPTGWSILERIKRFHRVRR